MNLYHQPLMNNQKNIIFKILIYYLQAKIKIRYECLLTFWEVLISYTYFNFRKFKIKFKQQK